MLCENCHKKQAIMHMVCLVGDKQIDKWLCGDCAKDYLPMGMGDMPLTPEGAKRFLDEMMKGAGRKPKKRVTREGFSEAAAKVLELSDKIVQENKLTTLMITHNMKDAISHGNRLIMMNEGKIILDVEGEEKKKLTKRDLMDKFAEISGSQLESDQILLS